MTDTAIDSGAGGARSTRGRTPVYSARLGGEMLDVSFNAAKITMAVGAHDAATLTCVSTTLENTEGMLNSPISFYWGVAPRTEIFQGYVIEVTDEQGSQGSLSFTLSILGATKVLSSGSPRFWRTRTAPSAAESIAQGRNLRLGGHVSDFAWSSLAQTCETDWEMVNKLAEKLGWLVCYRYGVILLYDPVKLFNESGSYAALVSNVTDTGEVENRNLIKFEATTLGEMLKENLGTKFAYFDGTTPQVATQDGEYLGYVFDTSRTLRGAAEARVTLAAEDTKLDSWHDFALARIWGDADIYPGMCVTVTTVTERYLYAPNDGKWMVRGVAHQADPQNFQTLLTLTRPKTRRSDPTRAYRPFWEEQHMVRPSLVLNGDSWYTSWAEAA